MATAVRPLLPAADLKWQVLEAFISDEMKLSRRFSIFAK